MLHSGATHSLIHESCLTFFVVTEQQCIWRQPATATCLQATHVCDVRFRCSNLGNVPQQEEIL
jgi:hypothetical protein